MQAIREIRDVSSQELIFNLPEEFLRKKIEIIILPVEEGLPTRSPGVEDSILERELDGSSWEMGPKLYVSREQLHER